MTITSPTPDLLVSASTPIANKTDLMTMEGDSSKMGMRYVKDIPIPAKKPVSLNPALGVNFHLSLPTGAPW